MLFIHTCTQLEDLKNEYATVIKAPLSHVFATETVVVQNAGMARWLSMEMADISSISANTEYLFPAEFMWRLLRIVSPDIPEHSQCAPDTLRFRLYSEITVSTDQYPELHHYIHKTRDTNENKPTIDLISSWELACQLAQLFDQYLFYRSDWIQQWEASHDPTNDHWQSRLWNRCVRDNSLLHWLELEKQFSNYLHLTDNHLFAERISFFSMSALSPSYIELLGKVAEKIDIHIFLINPCHDVYWGNIQSPKQAAKASLASKEYTEIGNPLLASLGHQGRDFISKLMDLPNAIDKAYYSDLHIENGVILSDTNLSVIQADINQLNAPNKANHLKQNDRSIVFQSCHTPMREVEVLYDSILDLINTNKNLVPSDFVVMMPDIEKYAPYIEAVFNADIHSSNHNNDYVKRKKLPYSIADREPQQVHTLIQALEKLLLLPESRFDVESVFELLEYDTIRNHFKLDENHVSYCRHLARSTNIRWGISAGTRNHESLPNTDEHTWKYALNRILLGYCLTESSRENVLFSSTESLDLLPYSGIEGQNALIYAQFKHFTDTVFSINQWRNQSLTLSKWVSKTKRLIKSLSPDDKNQQQLFKALSDLEVKADIASFDSKIPYDVFQQMLKQCLSSISTTEKFLGYGITFCALVPMRSVPFKVVALMGMNDGEFPRQDHHHSFDLSVNKTRKGDRSRRNEDKYLFLESLLAAREKLIISYIGQSIKDNTEIPPSTLVSELIDTLSIMNGCNFHEHIIRHPLHAFSPKYFENTEQVDSTFFSYAAHFSEIPLNNEQLQKTSTSFINKPIVELEDAAKTVSIDELVHFFKNPSASFLKRRFNIVTYIDNKALETREPFSLETFKEREIRDLLLFDITQDNHTLARAEGLLPYGEIGETIFNNEQKVMKAFIESIPEQSATLKESFVKMEIDEFTLSGTVKHSVEGRQIISTGKPYASDFLRLWFDHLFFNASASKGLLSTKHSEMDSNTEHSQTMTSFYSPELSFQFLPLENPIAVLSLLLTHYWQGLHYPLAFFPKTSLALYNHPVLNGKASNTKGDLNTANASTRWHGNDFIVGEKYRYENTLLHSELVIEKMQCTEGFIEYSNAIFKVMIDHISTS